MLWYTREASVAVYMSNLPMIWPLLREWFPCLRALTPRADRTCERQGPRTPVEARYTSSRSARWMTILSDKGASGRTTLHSSSLEPPPGIRPKDPRNDIEMAIRGEDSVESSKSGGYRSSKIFGDQPGAGGWHDISSIDEVMRIKTPSRCVSRVTTVENNFRLFQLGQEARDAVMNGTKAQTSFTVQEQVPNPPQSSHGGPAPEPWAPTGARSSW
jgi:hypothetical protein